MMKVKQCLGFLSAALLLWGTAQAGGGQAGMVMEPSKGSDKQSVVQGGTLVETQGRLSIYLRYVPTPESITVFHPNGNGKIGERFSPFAYAQVTDTTVFHLTVENKGDEPVEAMNMQVQMMLNGLPRSYLGKKELMEIWRQYYSLNTNTVTGAPDFMEQERALMAEKYLDKNAFSRGDIPPGGKRSGYIAVEKVKETGSLTVNISNLQSNSVLHSFSFAFTTHSGT